MEGWIYYNHGAVPTCAPHEEADTAPIETGEIWNMQGHPLLARWTADFDCGQETNWWYLVRYAPFDVEALSKSARKHIRQAQKKCTVRRLDAKESLEALYRVYCAAFEKYEKADNQTDGEKFRKNCLDSLAEGCEYWGGFDRETGTLIGYMCVYPFEHHAELRTTKLDPAWLHLRVSDALYDRVLTYYLNEAGKRYVSSGSRNINHVTNTEDYKIHSFGYKRAYCRLCIAYDPKIRWLVKLLYPFRGLLGKLDGITKVHQVNAVLKMEELVRGNPKRETV